MNRLAKMVYLLVTFVLSGMEMKLAAQRATLLVESLQYV